MGCYQTKINPYQVKEYVSNKLNERIEEFNRKIKSFKDDQENQNDQFNKKRQTQIKSLVYIHQKGNSKGRLLGGSNMMKDNEYITLVKQYNDFVQDVRNNTKNLQPTPCFGINEIKYQSKLLNQAQQSYRIILVNYVQFEKICYRVYISQYEITINIKILNRNNSIDCSKAIYKGGFGQIYHIENQLDNSCELACLKLLRFNQHKGFLYFFLQNVVREVAISKLLSSCEIGPRFFHFFHKLQFYDMILFNDAICYKMQYCTPISQIIERSFWQKNSEKVRIDLYQKIDRQLSSAVVFLHKLKLVHRDIKTSNILYNERSNRFIFCDFGLSHSVKQSSLDRSVITQLAGTRGYMYPELQRLFYLVNDQKKKSIQNIIQTTHYANLYINDLYALKKTLYLIYQKLQYLPQQENIKQFQKIDSNILSFDLNNKRVVSKQDQLRFLRMIYGFNHLIEQKWILKIKELVDQQRASYQKSILQKYKTKFTRILENNLENKMEIEMLEKNRGLNYNFFTFQEFINIENQILQHNINPVNLLRIIISVLKSYKNIPSYQLTYQKLLDLNQQKNEQNYSNKISTRFQYQIISEKNIKNSLMYLLANEQQPGLIKYFWQPTIEKQENSIFNKIFRLLLDLYIQTSQATLVKIKRVLQSLQTFSRNRRTILFMDQLTIQTSSEDFGEIFMQASKKMKKIYYAKNHQELFDLQQAYQQAITKKNVDLYQQISMLYTQSAYQCCNKDSQRALNYCNQATKILQHIKRVTDEKQSHYSCCGLLLLIRLILKFRQRKHINIQNIKYAETLIKQTYGQTSIYCFQILFLKLYYQKQQKNYQQIFKDLFEISNFDYNFFQYTKITQYTKRVYSQLNSSKKGLEQIHLLILKQLSLIEKIISSKSTQKQDQQFLKKLKTRQKAKLFKRFMSIILPRFNLFDLTKQQNIIMLQQKEKDIKNLKIKSFPYKRFILNNAIFLNKKNKIYEQINETQTQQSVISKKQIDNQNNTTKSQSNIQIQQQNINKQRISSGVQIPSASILQSFQPFKLTSPQSSCSINHKTIQFSNISCLQIE